jgi:arginine repressor
VIVRKRGFCSQEADARFRLAIRAAKQVTNIGKEKNMPRLGVIAVGLLLLSSVCAAQQDTNVVHGTVTKVDQKHKSVVVKTADGTEHVIKTTGDTAYKGGEEGFDGLKEGSEVVARTSGKGVEETGKEVGKVGKDGLKVTEGTVEKVDHDGKTVLVKTADGSEKSFEYTEDAGKDIGKTVGEGAEKGAKVTVYYTEEGPKKIAHFFGI